MFQILVILIRIGIFSALPCGCGLKKTAHLESNLPAQQSVCLTMIVTMQAGLRSCTPHEPQLLGSRIQVNPSKQTSTNKQTPSSTRIALLMQGSSIYDNEPTPMRQMQGRPGRMQPTNDNLSSHRTPRDDQSIPTERKSACLHVRYARPGSHRESWTSLAMLNGHNVFSPVGNFCATLANDDGSVREDRPD